MSDIETEKLADLVFQSVRVYVQRHTAQAVESACKPLLERIAIAEKTMADLPKPLSADEVTATVEKAVAAIEVVVPPPPREMIEEMVREEVGRTEGYTGPAGKDGIDGRDGRAGADAVVDYAAIRETIKAAVEALPKPAEGRDGRDGPSGKDGEKGADGHDGFGLEDFAVELAEDGRTLRFKFVRGDVVKAQEVVLPTPFDVGVFKVADDTAYQRGDGVTHNGCWWIARQATKDVPGTSSSWRLAVKAGRDGKDLRPEGAPPPREPIRMR